jgi:hypothetical protein
MLQACDLGAWSKKWIGRGSRKFWMVLELQKGIDG